MWRLYILRIFHARAAWSMQALNRYNNICTYIEAAPQPVVVIYARFQVCFQVCFSARSWTCSRTSVGRLVLLPAEGKTRTCSSGTSVAQARAPASGGENTDLLENLRWLARAPANGGCFNKQLAAPQLSTPKYIGALCIRSCPQLCTFLNNL